MKKQLLCLLLLAVVVSACRSARAKELESIRGQGLVGFDREAPVGAATFVAPVWKTGDAFVFVKGGCVRLSQHARSREDGGWDLVEDESGTALHLDRDFAELGQSSELHPDFDVTNEPLDARFSWPLWVGKRWSCHFVRNAADGGRVPLFVNYHCDAEESVTVKSGTFRCLRIWRRVQVAFQGTFIDRAQILWYAPEVGAVVQRIDDGIVTELVEFHRQ